MMWRQKLWITIFSGKKKIWKKIHSSSLICLLFVVDNFLLFVSLHSINYCNLLLAKFYINENQKRNEENLINSGSPLCLLNLLLFLLVFWAINGNPPGNVDCYFGQKQINGRVGREKDIGNGFGKAADNIVYLRFLCLSC